MQNDHKNRFVFTSQSVTSGHPDKICDRISDAILDHCLKQDPEARVACQCAVKNSICFVFGEISGKFENNFEQLVRNTIKKVGYDSIQKGMDYKSATIIIAIDKQSEQIAQTVVLNKELKNITAGDQGVMIGYATDQTQEYMPLTHQLCNKLVAKIQQARNKGQISWLGPDGKVQVSVQYKKQNDLIIPVRIHTVLVSVQHQASITHEQIQSTVKQKIIKSVINQKYIDQKTKFLINPSKSFVVGGPYADSGLTGRKIICDTYGGWGGHGGGAFSGKDPTKVDRSGAYAARWIAKSLVANNFCKKCLVQISYGIGICQPISLYVDSYKTVTEGYSDYDLQQIVRRNFDLRPGMIIQELDLRKPIYQKTASGGHFGRNLPQFKWETVKNLQHQKIK